MKLLVLSASFLSLFFVPFLSAAESGHGKPTPIWKGETILIQFAGISPDVIRAYNGLYKVGPKGYLKLPKLEAKLVAEGRSSTELEKQVLAAYKKAKIHPGVRVTIQRS